MSQDTIEEAIDVFVLPGIKDLQAAPQAIAGEDVANVHQPAVFFKYIY